MTATEDKEVKRQYALEKALEALAIDKSIDLIKTADNIYNFIGNYNQIAKKNMDELSVIELNLGELSGNQAKILKAAVVMYRQGTKLNGAALHRFMKGRFSQPCCSSNLLKLIEKGYLSRVGNTFFVQYDEYAKAVAGKVTKLPPALAQGYKGQKLGDHMPQELKEQAANAT